MITPNTMTCLFLLNRSWPIQQLKSGKASEIVKVALEALNSDELAVVKEYEQKGSLLHL